MNWARRKMLEASGKKSSPGMNTFGKGPGPDATQQGPNTYDWDNSAQQMDPAAWMMAMGKGPKGFRKQKGYGKKGSPGFKGGGKGPYPFPSYGKGFGQGMKGGGKGSKDRPSKGPTGKK